MRIPRIASLLLGFGDIVGVHAFFAPDQEILSSLRPGPDTVNGRRPNIIFILTDDQDVHLDSLEWMPQVKKHLLDQGTSFTKHYCTTAVCCPSRVTLWTGKAAHNTNITDVNPPYGIDLALITGIMS
jgi:hypothetical protein